MNFCLAPRRILPKTKTTNGFSLSQSNHHCKKMVKCGPTFAFVSGWGCLYLSVIIGKAGVCDTHLSSRVWLLKLKCAYKSPEKFVKNTDSDLVVLEWDLRFSISNKLLANANTGGPRIILSIAKLQSYIGWRNIQIKDESLCRPMIFNSGLIFYPINIP